MINHKKLIYEMKHGKIKHYQPYKKTTKITNVMKQTDKILNSYYPNSNLTDAQGHIAMVTVFILMVIKCM